MWGKMWGLLVLMLFSILRVKGGWQFSNCLGDSNYQGIIRYTQGDPGIYNYGFTYGCYNGKCSGFPIPFSNLDITFQCTKLSQSTFCITTGSSATGKYGGLCGGILGNTIATNFSNANPSNGCPSLNAVANALSIGPTTDRAFTWLCCDNALGSCRALSNVPVNNGWATTNCGHGRSLNSLMCFADNDGWACAGGQDYVVAVGHKLESSIYTGISSTSINHCALQLGRIPLSYRIL
ncbi:17926_t:CDS:1 [Cetraspora pellucida]|uniref:17926_t:CDS:1 n=1 Tax=Cetraspora pellucida TaxID=1433469 RepID=A0A9N8ZEL1_9GLOM|nr:17926_t:CDS:1 [Cetraspora pellucida]